jgi:AcrR family transcriptional regulator
LPRGDKRPTARRRPTSTRRSSEEVRTLVLTSARRLFSLHGYRGTSTRDVATDAGVTAAAIYRHFGSKEGLFEAAVEEPLHHAIEGFLQDWEFLGPDRSNNAAAARLFLKAFFTLLRQNRELTTAYLQGHARSDAEESVLSRELGSVVDRVQSAVTGQGLVGVDVPVVVRCVTGMILSLVLYDDFLFPPDDHPSDERILTEVVSLILRGIESRDAVTATTASR